MYCPSSFIISYRHPCAVLQLGHPRVHPFLGLATILVPLSVLPGPQCYLDFPLVNSVSLRFSFLTTCLFLTSLLRVSSSYLVTTLLIPSTFSDDHTTGHSIPVSKFTGLAGFPTTEYLTPRRSSDHL